MLLPDIRKLMFHTSDEFLSKRKEEKREKEAHNRVLAHAEAQKLLV
jgi:hypothetical protein